MTVLSPDRLRTVRRVVLALLLAFFVAHDLIDGVAQLVSPHAGTVDFRIYFAAARALAHGGSLYAAPPPCCFNAAAMAGYTYPPLFAFLLIPLTGLPVDEAGRIWLGVSYVSLAGMLALGVSAARPRLSFEAIAWLVLVMLSSAQIGAAIYGIQVDPFILLLEAFFAWSVIRNRQLGLGGLALALGACIKISPLLIAPAILVLPRPRALRSLAGLLAGLAAGGVAMLIISPLAVYYVTHVLPSFSGGVVAPWNRSLPGVVLRSLDAAGLHPGNWLGTAFLVLEIAVLAATWFICARAPDKKVRALIVAGLLAAVPIVQGVTWDHHLVVEILVLVLLAPMLRVGTLAWFLAVGGVLLSAVNQQIVDRWLTARGLEPPHGAGQLALFTAAACIDLGGMVATLSAVLVLARRQLQRDEPKSGRHNLVPPEPAATLA